MVDIGARRYVSSRAEFLPHDAVYELSRRVFVRTPWREGGKFFDVGNNVAECIWHFTNAEICVRFARRE